MWRFFNKQVAGWVKNPSFNSQASMWSANFNDYCFVIAKKDLSALLCYAHCSETESNFVLLHGYFVICEIKHINLKLWLRFIKICHALSWRIQPEFVAKLFTSVNLLLILSIPNYIVNCDKLCLLHNPR